jgi:hypothetical protein
MERKYIKYYNSDVDPYGEEVWEGEDIIHAFRELATNTDCEAADVWNRDITVRGPIFKIFGDSEFVFVTNRGIFKFDDLGNVMQLAELPDEVPWNWDHVFGVRSDWQVEPNLGRLFERSLRQLGIDLIINHIWRKRIDLGIEND